MSRCKVFAVGGSAGSLEVILSFLPQLRTDLKFPILIVLHRKSGNDSVLVDLLASRTELQVKEAEDKDVLKHGTVYVAPADYHLLVEKDYTLSLDFSEKVNFSRPSIDVTFETVAEAYSDSAACLLLSGASSDGSQGLKVVKRMGGYTLVQSPASSEVPYMPEQAIARTIIDKIVDAADLSLFINSL